MGEEWIDEAFLREVSRGDADALQRLYYEYAASLNALAWRMTGSPSDAEDVVHDLFVDLPRAVRTFEGRGSFAAWLRQIARRRALMVLRTRRRRGETKLDPSHASLGDRVRHATDRITIDQALTALSDDLRVVFVLKEIEGYPHTAIAAELGISKSASKVRLHRAKAALRNLLNGHR